MSAEVLELKDCDEAVEILRVRPSRAIRVALLCVLLLLGCGAGWARVAKVDIVVRAAGRVRPSAGPLAEVCSEVGGRIAEARCAEGDRVERGGLLARLDSAKLDDEIEAQGRAIRSDEEECVRLDALLGTIRGQEAAALARIDCEVEAAEAEERLAELDVADARRRGDLLRELVKEGLEAEQKLREAEGELARAKVRFAAARARTEAARGQREIARKDGAARREEAALRLASKRASAERAREALRNLGRDRERCEIRAPISGIVVSGRPQVGDFVHAGRPILAVAPEAGLRIEAVVPASEVGLLGEGMAARARFDAFDYREYGSLGGRVEWISPDSETNDRGETVYRVRVRVDAEDLGGRARLRMGLTAQVEIVTRRESVSTLLFRKVRGEVSF
ncbi:MAG: HlyD family efflux transporter periplasmic adaptor subunit [Planctomycetes bacterium]|nr:HlyD family efflux transporter periplasmic adaptor subunit [Planctomycetota bacterium]